MGNFRKSPQQLNRNKNLNDLFTDTLIRPRKTIPDESQKIYETDVNLTKKDSIESLLPKTENNSLENSGYDSGFIDLLSDYKTIVPSSLINDSGVDTIDATIIVNDIKKDENTSMANGMNVEHQEQEFTPSFDILSKDMDVGDLVDCSQKLLQSVTNTIQQSKVIENKIDEYKQPKTDLNVPSTSAAAQIQRNSVVEMIKSAKVEIEVANCDGIVLPEGSIRQWARELVICVSQLHTNDVILGDLRMDNILLGKSGQLQLSFFYQRCEQDICLNLNSVSLECMYVAPERPLTQLSDWWSVGVILFELLTRKSFYSCHPGGISCYYDVQYPDVEISDEAKSLLEGVRMTT